MPITIDTVRNALRADAVGLALGSLLVVAGLLAAALSPLARRRLAPTLYLGIFTFLYGLRQLARTDIFRIGVGGGLTPDFWDYLASGITYAILIPAALFAREIEPAWRRFWTWAIAGLTIFAAIAIAYDAIRQQPESAVTVNNLLAIGCLLSLLGKFFRPGLPHTPELRLWRIGVASVAVTAIADNLRGMGAISFTGPDLEPFGFTVTIACLATLMVRRMTGDARRLASIDRELGIARDIQRSILPLAMPTVTGIDVAACYRPMTAVAGDFYDFLPIGPGRIGVLIADVSGHGVPAALIASMVKIALASQQGCADRPDEVLTGINHALSGKLAGRYVTAAYLFVDAETGLVRYAAAGHPPMLYARNDGQVEDVEQNGLLLGFMDEAVYESREMTLHAGERLLLYTDGLFEAENPSGDAYGLERVRASLAAAPRRSPLPALDSIVGAMDQWSGLPGTDDLTLVLVQRTSPSSGGPIAATPPPAPGR